ncbi:MAG: AAA family ATPase [Bacteroidales bacterium]|nr:AAA family ATPase [Bacteroidales bacterium]
MTMKNPFLTYGYNGPAYFCDREKETKRLTSLLQNGNHVALMSPRRMGKTGLIRHCFAQKKLQGSHYLFLVDIYATKSLAELTYELGRAILSILKSKERKAWEHFIQIAGSLRTGITFDAFGQPSWNLELGDVQSPKTTLDEIFQYLSTADKPCIVAIDEFQTITDYPEQNVEALLRTYIQKCNNAWFVFSGSKRHMMGEMFSSPARPFYQSASTLSLKPIPLDAYNTFITQHFEQNNYTIEPEAIGYMYEKFEGTTWYIQKICNELFAMAEPGIPCDVKDVDAAICNAVEEKEDTYQDLMTRLSSRQKTLLLALAHSGRDVQPTSGEFIRKFHLTSASAVQRSLSALQEKDIVTNNNGKYYIYDYFLYHWLKNK